MNSQREAEINYLEQYYEKPGSHIVVIYGEHGIGKTALTMNFVSGKDYVYLLATNESERSLCSQFARELEMEGAELPEYPSFTQIWEEILRVRSRKKVIILDEFQNLVKNSDTFMNELVGLVKKSFDQQEVLVLLCSSTVGWVENSMIRKMGRAALELAGLLKLKELPFKTLRGAYSVYSFEECVRMYAVLGGIPAYWNCFDKELSIEENICRTIIDPAGVLYHEAQRLVGEELRELVVYNTILSAMAQGRNKLNELYRHTGFSRAKISVYLKNLMELELVEKVFSFDTEGRANSQKGIYRIKNSFVEFYYTFVYPHQGKLTTMTPAQFYDSYIRKSIDSFCNRCFKNLCLEYLDRQGSYSRKGEWLGKTGNLDLVLQNENQEATIGLCSFDKAVTLEDYEWFLFCAGKAKIVPDHIEIFSGVGFDKPLLAEEKRNRILTLNLLENLRFEEEMR